MPYLSPLLLPTVFFSWLLPVFLQAQSRSDSLYAAVQALPNDSTKAFKINNIAATIARSDPSAALRYAEEALAISEQTGYPSGQAKAHYTMGIAALSTGQMEEALENYTEALRICNRYALRRQKADVLRGMSNYFRESGDTEAAKNYIHQSVSLSRELGDSLSVAKSLNNLGTLSEGLPQQTCYLQAATILEALMAEKEDPATASQLVIIYNNLSNNFFDQDDYESALTFSQKALDINKKTDNKFNYVLIYFQFAIIYDKQGKYQAALHSGLKAINLARNIDNRSLTAAKLQETLSDIYLHLHDYPEALKYAKEAQKLFKELDNQELLAESTYAIARILHSRKDYSQALSYANDALNIARLHEQFPLMTSCESLAGEIFSVQGQDSQAMERFLRAASLIEQHALSKADFSTVYQNLAKLYTRQGKTAQAKEMQAIYDALPPAPGTH